MSEANTPSFIQKDIDGFNKPIFLTQTVIYLKEVNFII